MTQGFVLLGLAGLNAALFHATVYRTVDAWGRAARSPLAARVLAGVSATLWFGVMGPAGLPADLVKRLHTELNMVMTKPEVRAHLTEQGYTVAKVPLASPADFSWPGCIGAKRTRSSAAVKTRMRPGIKDSTTSANSDVTTWEEPSCSSP